MLGWHGVLSRRQERFARKSREGLPESRTGLKTGDFGEILVSIAITTFHFLDETMLRFSDETFFS
jgi:hypothetical protein